MEYSLVAGGYVRTLLLTGQRRDEVRLMAWRELDLEAGEWLIPAERSKNKNAHLVFLPRRALEELSTIKARQQSLGIDSDYVFTALGDKPYAGLRRLKQNLDRDSGVEGWVFHDIRRTFSTSLSRLGVQPRDRRACLNHSIKDGLDKVYDLYDLREEKKLAFDAWGDFLVDAVGEPNEALDKAA